MDRFIGRNTQRTASVALYLKSNMDRFIDWNEATQGSSIKHLKSNMDRFIVIAFDVLTLKCSEFKIQYG